MAGLSEQEAEARLFLMEARVALWSDSHLLD